MITGQLGRASQLAEKHKLDVNTILELTKIIAKEVNGTQKIEDKILLQMIQILENNKTLLRRQHKN